VLLDHPAVVGVLNEILSHQQLAGPEAYGFRLDHTFCSQLREGEHNFDRAHGGGGLWSFRGNSHIYQMQPGRVHSGLTRVAWELEPIACGEGTHFASGSHKSAIARPAEVSGEGESGRLFDSYECPAGSCVIFTEACVGPPCAVNCPCCRAELLRSCAQGVPQRRACWAERPSDSLHVLRHGRLRLGPSGPGPAGLRDRDDAAAAAVAVPAGVASPGAGLSLSKCCYSSERAR
jgi:hypothetical protein